MLRPILETSGLVAGEGFHLAMSPERIDPGRTDFTDPHHAQDRRRAHAGLRPAARSTLYSECVETLVPVSSCDAAELTKLLENIFRSVNIALVNELAMLCDRMGLNVWEVVEAAATKPYGFMPFKPGPGLGGHCLPIDPFYLSWKAREYDFPTEFIELAGKVNQHMPYYCAERVARALNDAAKAVCGSRVLVLGVVVQGQRRRRARVPGAQADRAAAAERGETGLPRPARAGARRSSGSSRRSSPTSCLQTADIVCVVTAHAAVDHAARRRALPARDRLPRRRPGPRRQGGDAVSDAACRSAWSASAAGARTCCATSARIPQAELRYACDSDAGRREAYAASLPDTRPSRTTSRRCSPTPRSTRWCSRRRCRTTTRWRAPRSRRAST